MEFSKYISPVQVDVHVHKYDKFLKVTETELNCNSCTGY